MQMSEKLKAHEADDGQIDLEFTEEAQDVVLEQEDSDESSTPNVVLESESDDEHEKYSNSVQKRINQLTKRAKEAEREREEALRYAQNIQAENTDVKQRLQTLDRSYIDEYGHRVTSEQARAKDELKSAIETGDTDRQMQAQERITQLTLAADKHAQAKASRAAQAAQAEQQQAYAQQQAAQAQYQPAPRQAAPDQKAEEWASKNDWFGEDDAMTFAAFGLHKKLVQEEGFDPASNDYYDALDSRMKNAFPHRFPDEEVTRQNRSGQTVAGVSRSKGTGRGKKVRLSPSQVTIAKRLGVPLEEYAKYVKEGQ
jgi:hypothetical protein|tara:strand:- start:2091 stop:3026 length:936 start_codon:yes stop_codon:yes gene_type:complete